MLDVESARGVVLQHAKRLPAEITAVMSSALGMVLAADVPSDVDSPPFDKSLMDGYAVRTTDLTSSPTELRVVEEVAAGVVPMKSVGVGEAIRIFTGAPLPAGADAVVVREKTTLTGDRVSIHDQPTPGQHILRRAAEMAVGQTVLPAGSILTPAAFGLLASVGHTTVSAYPLPRVGVLATGNELVEPNMKPMLGQIRNTNGPMLMAQAARSGSLPRYLGIARDDEHVLRSYLREGLNTANILIVAGGVSAGDFDLVPKVLGELGVVPHFHHIKMKPGKPLFFGTRGDTLVFGLPGNPVSSFVGFELFVKPAIRALSGHPDTGPRMLQLSLADDLKTSNNRPTFHPAKRTAHGGVRALPWFGSPDLRAMLEADALLVLPSGEVAWPVGTRVTAIPLVHTRKDLG